TLGGLSPSASEQGLKRHPTVEDDVVLYAGATILGGEVVIGKGSVIGGNVWLTSSIAPNSRVYYKPSIDQMEETNNQKMTYEIN
ncbi:MAG: serine acetyltransferase, partial [Crocinitomicaceae bacterium]|nr:serine acetyltransferase [Crocinitomicaceae bacterium]